MFVINIWHYLVPDSILQDSLIVENDKSHLLFESFFTTILLQALCEWVNKSDWVRVPNSGHLLTKWMASQYIMPDWMIDWLWVS